MVFKNDGTVDFLKYNWKGNELEDDYKKILYLFSFINKRYFRITLIVKKNTNFMDGFLSGDIRVREDGDFFVKAVLPPVSCKTRQSQIEFEGIDKYFAFIPHEHQKILKEPKTIEKTETVGMDKKNDQLDEVLSWSVDALAENLFKKKIIDEEEKKLLKGEKVDGETFVELQEDELKEIGLKLGTRKKLMNIINKL